MPIPPFNLSLILLSIPPRTTPSQYLQNFLSNHLSSFSSSLSPTNHPDNPPYIPPFHQAVSRPVFSNFHTHLPPFPSILRKHPSIQPQLNVPTTYTLSIHISTHSSIQHHFINPKTHIHQSYQSIPLFFCIFLSVSTHSPTDLRTFLHAIVHPFLLSTSTNYSI